MKQSVNVHDFREAFRLYNRLDNFSYNALDELFNYYEELEEDIGEEIELDVIAICCDCGEYTEEEIMQEWDMTPDELQDETIVLKVEHLGGQVSYLVESF